MKRVEREKETPTGKTKICEYKIYTTADAVSLRPLESARGKKRNRSIYFRLSRMPHLHFSRIPQENRVCSISPRATRVRRHVIRLSRLLQIYRVIATCEMFVCVLSSLLYTTKRCCKSRLRKTASRNFHVFASADANNILLQTRRWCL